MTIKNWTRSLALLAACSVLGACAQRDFTGSGDAHPPVRELVVLERVAPQYPYDEARAGVQGCVVTSFIVRGDGRADQILVHDSRPYGVFDRASINALKQWRFTPPARPGTRYAHTLDFTLPPAQPGTDFVVQAMPECRANPSFAQLNPKPYQRADRQADSGVEYDANGWPVGE